MKHRPPSRGFTLIELLVVVLISAVLSTLAILYSHVGQNEVSLSLEASKISELILEAKKLSVATYSDNNTICAYGVHIDYANQTYSLFEYNSATHINASPQLYCPTLASTTADGVVPSEMVPYLNGATWQIPISNGVVLESSSPNSDVLTDVLFYPPDPITLMSRDDTTFSTSTPTSRIYLTTVGGGTNGTISVSPAGQVGY
jgi:prepilin-type N-terminal cleavage/methylation domain-containing protein